MSVKIEHSSTFVCEHSCNFPVDAHFSSKKSFDSFVYLMDLDSFVYLMGLLVLGTRNKATSVLLLARIEFIFFTVASMRLCSVFLLKTVWILEGCFHYC